MRVDRFTDALVAAMRLCAPRLPGAWIERRGEAVGIFTGLRMPTLNGVMCVSPGASSGDVAALLERVQSAGVPHCLQLPAGVSRDVSELAEAMGMYREEDVPGMVLEDPALLSVAPTAPVSVRVLSRGERGAHLATLSEGFELPAELLAPLVESLDFPAARLYVGEVDGERVVTGAAISVGDAVGIYNIATPPKYRRCGYGTTLTARAVADGLAGGATWAFLQSSPMGYAVYERLGFRTVERWQLWVARA